MVGAMGGEVVVRSARKVRIAALPLEDHVGEHVLGELLRPGVRAAMNAVQQQLAAEADGLRMEVARLEQSRTELGESYATGELTRSAFATADRIIADTRKETRYRLRYLEQAVAVPLGGAEDLAAWREHAPFSSKRGLVVLMLKEIRVRSARARGVRAVDDRVELDWRTAVAAE